MTPKEIFTHCERQRRLGSTVVTFVLPGNSKRESRRLRGKLGGPIGKVVGQQRGMDVVMFDREEVADWARARLDEPEETP